MIDQCFRHRAPRATWEDRPNCTRRRRCPPSASTARSPRRRRCGSTRTRRRGAPPPSASSPTSCSSRPPPGTTSRKVRGFDFVRQIRDSVFLQLISVFLDELTTLTTKVKYSWLFRAQNVQLSDRICKVLNMEISSNASSACLRVAISIYSSDIIKIISRIVFGLNSECSACECTA